MSNLNLLRTKVQKTKNEIGALNITIEKLAKELTIAPDIKHIDTEIKRVNTFLQKLSMERIGIENEIAKRFQKFEDS